jgi:hypothetical protein
MLVGTSVIFIFTASYSTNYQGVINYVRLAGPIHTQGKTRPLILEVMAIRPK